MSDPPTSAPSDPSAPPAAATDQPSGSRAVARLSASDAPERSIPAGKVMLAGFLGLALAILLNSQVLLQEAEQKPFGWARDLSVAVWEPVEATASVIGLHLPRLWVDEALGRGETDLSTTDDTDTGQDETLTDGTSTDNTVSDGTTDSDSDSGNPDSGNSDSGNSGDNTQTDGGDPDAADPDPDSPDTDSTGTGDSDSEGADNGDGSTSSQLPTPTSASPLNLWVIGDSITHFFGDEMVQLANDTGVIAAQTESQISSGLTRPDYYNWPDRLIEILRDEDPDVVVLTLGGNDAQGLTVDDQVFATFSPSWNEEYAVRVGHVMDLVTKTSPDRLLIWGGIPIMKDPGFDSKMQQLNAIYEAEAAKRERVRFVPSRELFTGPDGGYSRYLPDASGQLIDARLSDGIHFSNAGGVLMSELLLSAIGEQVDLESGR